jgi:hypothetical protein
MSRSFLCSLSVGLGTVAALVPLAISACSEDTNLGAVDGVGGSGANAAGTGGQLFDDAGTGGFFEGCVSVGGVAHNTAGPATVVLFIDNSPSMRDEILWTRDNMNIFSQTVQAAGLDLRVVVIACMEGGDCEGHEGAWGICIPEPLGAVGGCETLPYDDTNLPGYLHIDVRIPSQKGFDRVLDTYDQWHTMLRPGTPLHIVGISDDTEELTAQQFDDALLALDPSLDGYYFHSIFSFQSKEDACAIAESEPCCLYAAPGGEGTPYRELALMTGGVTGDLCAQDFDPVFQQFATAVIESATLSCDWEIPPPPEGETLNPGFVNVVFVDENGDPTVIGMVSAPEQCDEVSHGWYYDNPNAPETVVMCPQTCTWIQGRVGAEVRIEFGCATEIAVPR